LGQTPIKMAVVGAGYFGSFHCQKMADLQGVELTAIVDIDESRATQAATRFNARPLTSHRDLIGQVDAAIVAVPTSRHYTVAAELLGGGLNLLVEKPLATSVAHADELCQLAAKQDLCLQVGHLERFNPIYIEATKRINQPKTIQMERCGPFPGRGGDVGVVLELMSHDLDILLQMTTAAVKSVSASGESIFSKYLDQARAEIEFEDGLLASLKTSRAASEATRKFVVEDRDGLLEVDLGCHKLARTFSDNRSVKKDDLVLGASDTLLDQDRAFVDVLCNGHKPLVSGEAGKAAISLAMRILECIHNGGAD